MPSLKPLAAVAAVFLVVASTGLAHAGDKIERTITIAGQGEVSVRPDTASVTAGVVTEAPNANAAVHRNTVAVKALFAALRDFGTGDRDMQTTGYSVNPTYTRPRPGEPPEIQGYRVSNSVEVRVRDLSRLGELLDRMVAAGANQLNGVRFYVADPQKALDAARVAAIRDALRKAKLYADAADARVGHVLTISESSAAAPMPLLRTMKAARAESVPVAVGEQTVRASVTVTFALK